MWEIFGEDTVVKKQHIFCIFLETLNLNFRLRVVFLFNKDSVIFFFRRFNKGNFLVSFVLYENFMLMKIYWSFVVTGFFCYCNFSSWFLMRSGFEEAFERLELCILMMIFFGRLTDYTFIVDYSISINWINLLCCLFLSIQLKKL